MRINKATRQKWAYAEMKIQQAEAIVRGEVFAFPWYHPMRNFLKTNSHLTPMNVFKSMGLMTNASTGKTAMHFESGTNFCFQENNLTIPTVIE